MPQRGEARNRERLKSFGPQSREPNLGMARNNQRLILEWLAPLNAIVRKGPHYFKP